MPLSNTPQHPFSMVICLHNNMTFWKCIIPLSPAYSEKTTYISSNEAFQNSYPNLEVFFWRKVARPSHQNTISLIFSAMLTTAFVLPISITILTILYVSVMTIQLIRNRIFSSPSCTSKHKAFLLHLCKAFLLHLCCHPSSSLKGIFWLTSLNSVMLVNISHICHQSSILPLIIYTKEKVTSIPASMPNNQR